MGYCHGTFGVFTPIPNREARPPGPSLYLKVKGGRGIAPSGLPGGSPAIWNAP